MDLEFDEEESPKRAMSYGKFKEFKETTLGMVGYGTVEASKWCTKCHELGRHPSCMEIRGSEFEKVQIGL